MSGYNCFALVVICVVLVLLWICLEKARTYGNAVTPLLELSAYLAFVVGFSYILDQKTANPDTAHAVSEKIKRNMVKSIKKYLKFPLTSCIMMAEAILSKKYERK